jgi:hypothetical protein
MILFKKIVVVGYFGKSNQVSNGQGVKTNIIYDELIRHFNIKSIRYLNTYNWKKHRFIFAVRILISFIFSKNVIFLTDENGIRVFPKLFISLNIFHMKKIHYIVVGGWLTDYLKINAHIVRQLKKLDIIYVEIMSMKTELEEH